MKTIIAYKLFRTLKSRPGKIFPLFIDKTTPVSFNRWLAAKNIPTKGYANRPGWHVGRLPMADHLLRKDGTLAEDRVWAEVEILTEIDWQIRADSTPTGDLRDQVPWRGYYRFKRPAHQGGEWLIAGNMRVNKLLTKEEVKNICEKEIGHGLHTLFRTRESITGRLEQDRC